MDHAARLVEEGLTVRAAARAVGYRQAGQFARAFRAERGHLPTAARPTSPDTRTRLRVSGGLTGLRAASD
jgi:AraC-like DNA-binding protein